MRQNYHCVNGDVDTDAKGLEQFFAFVFVCFNGDVDTNANDLEKFFAFVFVFGNEWITFDIVKKIRRGLKNITYTSRDTFRRDQRRFVPGNVNTWCYEHGNSWTIVFTATFLN